MRPAIHSAVRMCPTMHASIYKHTHVHTYVKMYVCRPCTAAHNTHQFVAKCLGSSAFCMCFLFFAYACFLFFVFIPTFCAVFNVHSIICLFCLSELLFFVFLLYCHVMPNDALTQMAGRRTMLCPLHSVRCASVCACVLVCICLRCTLTITHELRCFKIFVYLPTIFYAPNSLCLLVAANVAHTPWPLACRRWLTL